MTSDVRPWVARLGSYLRIFGGRGNAGSKEHRWYIDRLAEKAQEREAELASGPGANDE
jgi:hypothetical protein